MAAHPAVLHSFAWNDTNVDSEDVGRACAVRSMKLRGVFGSVIVPRPQEVQSSGRLLSGDRRDEDMGDRSNAWAQRQRVMDTLTRRVLLHRGLVCRGSAKPISRASGGTKRRWDGGRSYSCLRPPLDTVWKVSNVVDVLSSQTGRLAERTLAETGLDQIAALPKIPDETSVSRASSPSPCPASVGPRARWRLNELASHQWRQGAGVSRRLGSGVSVHPCVARRG